MDDTRELTRRVAEAAMRLAAERGWRRTGPVEVAKAAGVPLAAVYRHFPDRADLLGAVSTVADEAVLADGDADGAGAGINEMAGETARDRLFDVMMRRFDALLPFRDGLAVAVRDLRREPFTALAFARRYRRSMAWMLRAARIEADSPAGALRAAALGALHARVFRVWLTDDTADLARTMAALDGELRKAESWANSLCRRSSGGTTAGGAEPIDAPAV
ncbi:TetR/AcrR family transcriptional regulator [Azospirillum oleiclasticum]|nr:TetR/AcrR family transcriptional regulator [Azospirillum oleiclasticum]